MNTYYWDNVLACGMASSGLMVVRAENTKEARAVACQNMVNAMQNAIGITLEDCDGDQAVFAELKEAQDSMLEVSFWQQEFEEEPTQLMDNSAVWLWGSEDHDAEIPEVGGPDSVVRLPS